MRVVAGTARGRKLRSVPGDNTRPILDRVKTSLFDILRPELSEMAFLDLFAGSGAVGIEALSQGAAHCTFIDAAPAATEVIRANVADTGFLDTSEIRNTDAFTFLRNSKQSWNLIYVAPPQYRSLWIEAMHTIAAKPELLRPCGRVIVQIHPKEYEELSLVALKELEKRRYGNTLLLFYQKNVRE